MALTQQDVMDVLMKCTGYASDKTPVPSEMTLLAWCEHFSEARVAREEVLAAVKIYFQRPQDRLVQPADISSLARGLRRDWLDRNPPLIDPTFAEVQVRGRAWNDYLNGLAPGRSTGKELTGA